MSQTLITSALLANAALAQQMSVDAWAADVQAVGEKVALFRGYVDGDHRANLTEQMRKLLRVPANESLSEFNDNYCEKIVNAKADRVEITAVQAVGEGNEDADDANDWLDDLREMNEFEALQTGVHDDAIRDGDAYVLVDWDNDAGQVRITQEPAYDGTSGMIVLYNTRADHVPALAIKVWYITTQQGRVADTMRLNVYYPDRIEKYVAYNGGTLAEYEPAVAWPTEIGVPVRHLPNKARSYTSQGQSEIEDAIPLQDALNRLLYSMVASAELTGFGIRVAKGFTPPTNLTPGMWVEINRDGGPLLPEDVAEVEQLDQSEPTPFLSAANWVIEQMATITDTPLPQLLGGDSASGESLKQREIGLLGKVRRFQVRATGFWKQVFELCAAVQNYYGTESAPEWRRLKIQWRDAQLRNDVQWIQTAAQIVDIVGPREVMRQMASVYGWDEAQIERILAEKAEDDSGSFDSLFGMTNDFANTAALFGQGGAQQPAQPVQQVEVQAQQAEAA